MPYLLALAVYAASRLVVVLAIGLSEWLLPGVTSEQIVPGEPWYASLLRWDANWYARIAADGYHYSGDPGDAQTVVFYPLYPLLARLLASLPGSGVREALLIVANLAAIGAILLLFRLVRDGFGDRIALITVACISFFPGSLFLSAGYTEPLALLFILGCFVLLQQERYLLAAACAGLALATRSTAIVLMPVLLLEVWRKFGSDRARFAGNAAATLSIAAFGLSLYMAYLWVTFDAPLAFAEGQAAYHRGTTFGARVINAIMLEPFTRLRWTDLSPPGIDQWVFILFAALTVAGIRRLPPAMTLYSAGVLALPYLTLSGGPHHFTSMSRFALLAFPAFIVAAQLLVERRWLLLAVIGGLGALLFDYAMMFARAQWVG